MEPNLAESIYRRSSIKFLHFVPFRQQIWPPRAIPVSDWLMLKKSSPLKLLGKFGVIALFSSNFQNFNTFCPLFKKLEEIDCKFKLQTCSACQDLPTLQFLSKSEYPFWNNCPFFVTFSKC
jgi:hypothetical protein